MSALDKLSRQIFADRQIRIHQWLGIRKDAALNIDPATAEVHWTYGMINNPYGADANLHDECNK